MRLSEPHPPKRVVDALDAARAQLSLGRGIRFYPGEKRIALLVRGVLHPWLLLPVAARSGGPRIT